MSDTYNSYKKLKKEYKNLKKLQQGGVNQHCENLWAQYQNAIKTENDYSEEEPDTSSGLQVDEDSWEQWNLHFLQLGADRVKAQLAYQRGCANYE